MLMCCSADQREIKRDLLRARLFKCSVVCAPSKLSFTFLCASVSPLVIHFPKAEQPIRLIGVINQMMLIQRVKLALVQFSTNDLDCQHLAMEFNQLTTGLVHNGP